MLRHFWRFRDPVHNSLQERGVRMSGYIKIVFYTYEYFGDPRPVCVTAPEILTYALKANEDANETVQYLINNIIDILEKKEEKR